MTGGVATPNERALVRSQGRAARAALQGDDRRIAEASLVAHLQSVPALRAPVVGVFVAHDGEPDLMPLIEWLWGHGQTVALPVLVADDADHSMRFIAWQQGDALIPGRYGIPVPPASNTSVAVIPDTLLVSFVGFDRHGNRMGRGGGFFDRYLGQFSNAAVGVGFEAQRFDVIPTEDHDIALPVIVTDLGVRHL